MHVVETEPGQPWAHLDVTWRFHSQQFVQKRKEITSLTIVLRRKLPKRIRFSAVMIAFDSILIIICILYKIVTRKNSYRNIIRKYYKKYCFFYRIADVRVFNSYFLENFQKQSLAERRSKSKKSELTPNIWSFFSSAVEPKIEEWGFSS